MNKYDVIIIGSGLGGLECGYILSNAGYQVCILEQHTQIGGCLQSFRRGGSVFDTGFHYVGGLDEGQPLHRLFSYFDLIDLPWQRLDNEAFAEVCIGGQSFFLASGHRQFADRLSEYFPHQREQLNNYAELLKQVGDGIFDSFNADGDKIRLFSASAFDFLNRTIDDPLLRNVLSGASLTMELCSARLPLYVFAQINNSFIQSAWKLKGDGSMIANRLADRIGAKGGEIITRSKVTRLIETGRAITAVECNGDRLYECKYLISDIHPVRTLELIPDSLNIRRLYRNRITSIPNTFGMFTVHIKLKKPSLPYLNRNIFIYGTDKIWDYKPTTETNAVMVNYRIPSDGGGVSNIDILTPMFWDEVACWSETVIGRRGDDYERFKQRKAESCIALAATRIPDLYDHIDSVYTSTPLTYRDYTGTPDGAAYGISKDFNDVMGTLIAPQTPITNLFLTGQNLNLHGVLGVSMTSFFTCAKITGKNNLLQHLDI
jgi:all-trans-retinol 13,14-reductase